MSDLLYSDTEEALRDSVRRLFADRCPPEAVTGIYDAASQDFSGVWHTLAAELGMAGLLVPEQLGGAGASAREAAVVMEEIGRAVAPVPFLSSAVLATVALLHAGDTDTVKGLAAGSLTAALAVPLSTAPGDAIAGVSAGGNGLTGRITSVAGAGEADVLVVPVAGADGLELHTVARDAAGVDVSPILALDMTRPLANVEFSGAASSRVGTAVCRCRNRGGAGDGCGAARVRTIRHRAVVFRDDTWLMPSSASNSAEPSVPTRPSSIGSRICGSSSIPLRRRPGTRPTPAPDKTRTRRSRRPSRRPTAAVPRCTPPRNASSCTVASG